MRRSFAVLLFLALPLAAQTFRLGPEHVIPPSIAPSAYGRMIGMLPRGDGAVAFWGTGGPLHCVVLDRIGNVVSETVVPEIDGADSDWASVARAGDGYLVVNIVPLDMACLAGKTVATRLDGNFHVVGSSVELGVDLMPYDLACNATDCAVSLMHIRRTDCHFDDQYLSLLAFDGSVINDRLTLPVTSLPHLTATSRGFIGSFGDRQHGFHTIAFDSDGTTHTVSDFGTMPLEWSFGGVTAVGDGAIVVWPMDNTLRAARLALDGSVLETKTIATFDYHDFATIAVACSGSECTAGVEWYFTGYSVFEGVFFPQEEIHAVRFTTTLDAIDAKPVTIAKPSENDDLRIAATSAGAIIGWTALRLSTPRVAFLPHGNAPYAGDVNLPGKSINSGFASVRAVGMTRDAIAWSDLSADGQRTVRFTHLDRDGVPVEAAPLIVQQDGFNDYYAGADLVALGNDGDSYVLAWQNEYVKMTLARPGAAPQTMAGHLALPILTDGRESVLVTWQDQPSDLLIRRISGGTMSQPTTLHLDYPAAGALSNGKLFLQGGNVTNFSDFVTRSVVSTVNPNFVVLGAMAFGDRNALSLTYAFKGGYGGAGHVELRRFAFDGRPIDAQPMVIGDYGRSLAVVPLGPRFLIAWDESGDTYQGGRISIAIVDANTGGVSPPAVIANDGRILVALVPRDATHVLAVFKKPIKSGESYPNTILTQLIEVTTDLHHRSAAR